MAILGSSPFKSLRPPGAFLGGVSTLSSSLAARGEEEARGVGARSRRTGPRRGENLRQSAKASAVPALAGLPLSARMPSQPGSQACQSLTQHSQNSRAAAWTPGRSDSPPGAAASFLGRETACEVDLPREPPLPLPSFLPGISLLSLR